MIVISSPETTEISIDQVMFVALSTVEFNPNFRLKIPELAGLSAEIAKAMKRECVRLKLLEFCRDRNISPRKKDDPAACFNWDGDAGQDQEFYISIDEFRLFGRPYGIHISNDLTDLLLNPAKEARPPSMPTSVRLSPDIPLLSASGEEIEEPWDLEIEERLRSSNEKRKSRLKKQIPGKLPRTRIGKLAVKIAWGIEVDTGRKATGKEVMEHLCKLAATVSEADSTEGDEDCLLSADTKVPGKERVRWSTDDDTEKWYGQAACEQTRITWWKSIPQKPGRRR